jgi:hypothetical protein
VNEALGKQADWPKTSGWLQLVNGGEGPTFVLLNSRKNWADFVPSPKTLADVLNENYGKEVADQIQKTFRDSTAQQYHGSSLLSPRSQLLARKVTLVLFACGARAACSHFRDNSNRNSRPSAL